MFENEIENVLPIWCFLEKVSHKSSHMTNDEKNHLVDDRLGMSHSLASLLARLVRTSRGRAYSAQLARNLILARQLMSW